MGLTMNEKKAVVREVAKRYRKASKKQKGQILDEFVALTGYNRSFENVENETVLFSLQRRCKMINSYHAKNSKDSTEGIRISHINKRE